MKTTKLKPCPFCGNRPEWQYLRSTQNKKLFWIDLVCECGATVGIIERLPKYKGSTMVAKLWNRRTA